MSLPSATSLIATATEPCHHRREPFGPCITCLEDELGEVIQDAQGLLQTDLDNANERCRQQEFDADERQTEIEQEREAAIDATRKLVNAVREISGRVNNSTKQYIEQQLDAVADKADTAT